VSSIADGAVADEELESTFHRTVDEGAVRLNRTFGSLAATGFVGGADVSLGVLALYLVQRDTGSAVLAALAFPIGFVALTLARSELFTENFLVPVAAVVARDASVLQLLRLWFGTLLFNLAGGWVVTGFVLAGFPDLRHVAVQVTSKAAASPLDAGTLCNMILAGAVITLMTWMERSTESVPAKLVAAVIAAFLLAAGPMDHVIVVSVEMFGALHAGAPYPYAHWLGFFGWSLLGNMIGGLGLVTLLRLVQVGSHTLAEERRLPPFSRREDVPSGDGQ
jgi:formate/nitrite transporter FocA (FNT family)